jgi:hypothetical protein
MLVRIASAPEQEVPMNVTSRPPRRTALAAVVGATLAVGSLGLAPAAWSQSTTPSRSGSSTSAAADRELREAQQQVETAGEAVSEARGESREAVREGREAGRAAQREYEAERGSGSRSADEASSRRDERAGRSASAADAPGDAPEASRERTRTASADASTPPATRGSAESNAVWLLVPASASAQAEKQSKDCWVRLYSGRDFDGRHVTITGPAEIPELRSPYGTGANTWESAIVGPNATVMTYEDDNFEDRSSTLRAGERYSDLGDAQRGVSKEIESLRLTCESTGAQSGSASRSTETPRKK